MEDGLFCAKNFGLWMMGLDSCPAHGTVFSTPSFELRSMPVNQKGERFFRGNCRCLGEAKGEREKSVRRREIGEKRVAKTTAFLEP